MNDKLIKKRNKLAEECVGNAIDACEKLGYPTYDEPLSCLIEDTVFVTWNAALYSPEVQGLVEALRIYANSHDDSGMGACPAAHSHRECSCGARLARKVLEAFENGAPNEAPDNSKS